MNSDAEKSLLRARRMGELFGAALFLFALFLLSHLGGVLSVGPTATALRMAVFSAFWFGSGAYLCGLLVFHRRRVLKTGDPRATLYSAFSVYFAAAFFLLCPAIMFAIVGRDTGLLSDGVSSRISYTFISGLAVTVAALGTATLAEIRYEGLLARKIYLFPWSYWGRTARDFRRSEAGGGEDRG